MALYLSVPSTRMLNMDGQQGFEERLGELFETVSLDQQVPLSTAHETALDIEIDLAGDDGSPELEVLLDHHPELRGGSLSLHPLTRGGASHGVLAVTRLDEGAHLTWRQSAYLRGAAGALSMWGWDRRRAPEIEADLEGPVLTERQRAILTLIDLGYTNERIGRTLGYSTSTIKGDVGRLLRITGTHGRRQLLVVARRLRWLDEAHTEADALTVTVAHSSMR